MMAVTSSFGVTSTRDAAPRFHPGGGFSVDLYHFFGGPFFNRIFEPSAGLDRRWKSAPLQNGT
jgi:hypothetical protein